MNNARRDRFKYVSSDGFHYFFLFQRNDSRRESESDVISPPDKKSEKGNDSREIHNLVFSGCDVASDVAR